MPRPGPVTRSMTRAGTVFLQATPEQATAERALAEITVNQDTAMTYKSMTDDIYITDSSAPDILMSDSPSFNAASAEILTHNRMTILRLEQDGILTPGILTIDPSGELRADLTVEPDQGTMIGLYPNMEPSLDIDEQISSWIRDYLIKILNVHGHGPPALCRAFYDHLKDSQEDMGINHSVRTAESHLAYATISLRYAVDEVQNFANMNHVFKDTYEEEVWLVIKTIKRLVGYKGEDLPKDIRMLIDIAEMGITMKEALDEPLHSLIITPYTLLLDKLEFVSKALRMQLDRTDQETEKAREIDAPLDTPDSGIDVCWT